MVFKTRNRNIDTCTINVQIGQHKIKQVKFTKFLGIIIDDCLNWKEHVKDISCKISKAIGVLNRLQIILPLQILVNLY